MEKYLVITNDHGVVKIGGLHTTSARPWPKTVLSQVAEVVFSAPG
jgi:hypothetical protein